MERKGDTVEKSESSKVLQNEAQERLGLVPNFFKLAPEETGISNNLWIAAKFGYFDNPLPSLFKERLFVYLSRFCEVRYCIARHVGFLVGMGNPSGDVDCVSETIEHVIDLISKPLPSDEELDALIAILETLEVPYAELPKARTTEELAIFTCASHVFLQTHYANRCQEALRKGIEGAAYHHFLFFLSFVRMAHFWTVVHPELKLEKDIVELLAVQEELSKCVLNDPEAALYLQSTDLKEELVALRLESKKARLLETTLASIGEGVIGTDTSGKITILNTEAEALTGWSASEAVGLPLEEVFCPMGKAPTGVEVGLEGKVDSEIVLISKDGTQRFLEKQVSTIREADGTLVGSVLIFRDISERRKQILALAEKARFAGFGRDVGLALTEESSLSTMLNRCVEAVVEQLGASLARIWITSSDGKILDLEASAGVVDGLALDESFLPVGESQIGVVAKFREATVTNISVGDATSNGGEGERLDNSRSFVSVPLLIGEQVLGVMGMYLNFPISSEGVEALESVASGIALGVERMRSEDRIRESELRYRLVGQAANDAIWDWDLLTDEVDWNDGVLSLFGYDSEKVDRKSAWWFDRIHPEERDRVGTHINSLIKSGQATWREEYRFRKCDGSYAFVFDRGRVVRGSHGKPLRMVGSMLDVTQRKRSERRQAFLAELASATQPLVDPGDVTLVTARLLTDYLEANQCAFAEVEDGETFIINYDYSKGVPSLRGRWPVVSFGRECERLLTANEPYVVADTEHDERVEQDVLEQYRAVEIRSVICVPLHKDGKFTAAIGVHQCVPRVWTAEDVELVQLVAARCWETLERTRSQRRLLVSEERVRLAVQAADIGTWDYDLESDTLRWSDRCKEIFGLEPSGSTDYNFFLSRLHPEDRTEADAAVQGAFDPNGDGNYKIDYRVVWPDGSIRWIVATGECIFSETGANKRAVRFVGTVIDITDRKEVEEQLRASDNFTRTILQSTPDCIMVLDNEGRLQMINKQGIRMMAIEDFESARGQYWSTLWAEEGRERLREAVKCARTGQTDRFQSVCPTASGEPRWLDVVVSPVVDDAGRVSRLIAVSRDVTQQKSSEEQLRELASRLSEADTRKDEFLATLAHELRNPLAPIRSGLEVMKGAREDEAMFEEVRDMMERQTQQLITLVDDLLDLSRITLGKLELRKSKVELSDVLRSAQEASRPLMKEAEHRLTISALPRAIYLNADPNRMAQIVSNLLNNAAKYTPKGGDIRLSVEVANGEVAVTVRDNGIGIPKDMKELIFEMFAQVDRSFSNSYAGLGIGLTLVKSLVEMHDGSVVIESEGEGKGSSFTVRFPVLADEKEPDGLAVIEGSGASESKLKVLVVDDNEASTRMLSIVVKMFGNEARVAHDGEEAIAVAADYLPDVILMDIGMPRMTGDEAARYIRQQPWGKDMFLIALTGWGQEKDRRRTAEAGFDRHLVKPSEPKELRRLLAEAAQRRGG